MESLGFRVGGLCSLWVSDCLQAETDRPKSHSELSRSCLENLMKCDCYSPLPLNESNRHQSHNAVREGHFQAKDRSLPLLWKEEMQFCTTTKAVTDNLSSISIFWKHCVKSGPKRERDDLRKRKINLISIWTRFFIWWIRWNTFFSLSQASLGLLFSFIDGGYCSVWKAPKKKTLV